MAEMTEPTVDRPDSDAYEDGWYWVRTFNSTEWVPARVIKGKWALIYHTWATIIPAPDEVGAKIESPYG